MTLRVRTGPTVAGHLLAATLLCLLATACGSTAGPAGLPWGRAVGVRMGVTGWWNSALVAGSAAPRALSRALAAAAPLGACAGPPAGTHTAAPVLPEGRTAGVIAWSGSSVWVGGCAYTLPPPAAALLTGLLAQGRRAWSGRLLPWAQVAAAFPVGSRATITDWQSGRTLGVVRWGGRLHADVEPATAADAVTLRAIYGGGWSWARRPVLVTLPDGVRVAASMNGMPHGGGRIGANAFPGHFCLHFLGSRVHRSGRVDAAHLRAILTAAGRGPGGYLPVGGSAAPVAVTGACG